MPGKGITPEQVVAKLRQMEVLLSHGRTITLACKEAGITAAAETPKITCRNVASPDCTRSIASC